MYIIVYKPNFVRQYKKFSKDLQEEIRQKIEVLKENPKHPLLKSHILKGKLQGFWSCSVNCYSFVISKLVLMKLQL